MMASAPWALSYGSQASVIVHRHSTAQYIHQHDAFISTIQQHDQSFEVHRINGTLLLVGTFFGFFGKLTVGGKL
jgi:hypothetical protein